MPPLLPSSQLKNWRNNNLKYDIAINQPVGVETLLCWEHPRHGEISPVNIVPLAEQLGIVNRMTTWVMIQPITQCTAGRKQGILISIEVNLSVYFSGPRVTEAYPGIFAHGV